MIKLKIMLDEAITEPIYAGDILQVSVWNRYKGIAGVSSKNRIGYGVVVGLSPKNERDKNYTFRVYGWYQPISVGNEVGNKWKSFLEHNFNTKDVVKKITLNELPRELRKQAKEFTKTGKIT